MADKRAQIVKALRANPVALAPKLGFDLLGGLHADWVREMVFGSGDWTLQAHRGSYKTTSVSVALWLILILLPNFRTAFIRKTDDDVKEIMLQVQRMFDNDATAYLSTELWGVPARLVTANFGEMTTNLTNDPRGSAQLTGFGIGSSMTGKHYDRIFTDDIVNLKDRKSRAERERTKDAYRELQNLKNRGGRIINTGTPWHIDDCFSIMPEPVKCDWKSTGLMTDEEAEHIRERTTPSLWAANYELRHIPSDDVMFVHPKTGAPISMVEQGCCHVDAAYYGEDYTAFTAINRHDGKLFVYGRLWRKHIQDVQGQVMEDYRRLRLGDLFTEKNADKGYSAKDLQNLGAMVRPYSETMNKHIKITTHLKAAWPDIVFCDGTDRAYIDQVCDYTEDAEHDDAPDSLASLIQRAKFSTGYSSPFGL